MTIFLVEVNISYILDQQRSLICVKLHLYRFVFYCEMRIHIQKVKFITR